MKKSNKRIFVGLQGESLGVETGKEDKKYCQGTATRKMEVEERTNPAKLISRLNHPQPVSYGNETIQMSPRGKVVVADYKKLGELPQGIILKKM